MVLCQHHQTVVGTRTIGSARAIQQGDTLGTLMFSLAITDTVLEISNLSVEGTKLDMTTFYLDDGMIAGHVNVMAEVLHILESRCTALGLQLNHGKNELVLPAHIQKPL